DAKVFVTRAKQRVDTGLDPATAVVIEHDNVNQRWRHSLEPIGSPSFSTSNLSSEFTARCQVNCRTCSAPFRAMRRRNFSSRNSRSICAANSSTALTGANSADLPFAANSFTPLLAVDTSAHPHAIASAAGNPHPSIQLGFKKTWQEL